MQASGQSVFKTNDFEIPEIDWLTLFDVEESFLTSAEIRGSGDSK